MPEKSGHIAAPRGLTEKKDGTATMVCTHHRSQERISQKYCASLPTPFLTGTGAGIKCIIAVFCNTYQRCWLLQSFVSIKMEDVTEKGFS